ncbi:MAG: hypothetical protein WBB98_12070 [Xanthobacteraceae bacterium]
MPSLQPSTEYSRRRRIWQEAIGASAVNGSAIAPGRIRSTQAVEQGTHDRQLWCAVISQAIEDATTLRTSKEALRDKQEARAWLVGMSIDFVQACSLAGIDPEALRDRAIALFERDAGGGQKVSHRAA